MATDQPTFAYRRSPDQAATTPVLHPVIVVGAGPVGLTAAIDLAMRGRPVLLLDDDDRLSTGSRAICFAKRTLEIWDRLGCGGRMVQKGVSWSRGRVLFRDEEVYAFDLSPESRHSFPAFINLQQYHVESFLLERARELPHLEIRWRNEVVGIRQTKEAVELEIATPDGPYSLTCDYLIAADGARSAVRRFMGLESKGRTFRDRFLIADIKMSADLPTERRFWFDPPFHPGQSVLLHRQPDDLWRVDFQLGWDADPELERQPERVIPRVRALLGAQTEFTLEWVSVYTFACVRMERFRHGRVLFAGDAAHSVSPFGARGANSGVQDADNLVWKLDAALTGAAPETLLDSYGSEREQAADENIRHSSRSTDFITPKSGISRTFRDATLELARSCGFARRLVNTGRLSTATTYTDSPLGTPDREPFEGGLPPGAAAIDAPVAHHGAADWLLRHLDGEFVALLLVRALPIDAPALAALRVWARAPVPIRPVALVQEPGGPEPAELLVLHDVEGLFALRYAAAPGTVHLFRPDQHLAARWRQLDAGLVAAAAARALGHG